MPKPFRRGITAADDGGWVGYKLGWVSNERVCLCVLMGANPTGFYKSMQDEGKDIDASETRCDWDVRKPRPIVTNDDDLQGPASAVDQMARRRDGTHRHACITVK
jgi:hypothetical protein